MPCLHNDMVRNVLKTLKNTGSSLLDEVVDPFHIEGLRCLPSLLFLPGVIVNHE